MFEFSLNEHFNSENRSSLNEFVRFLVELKVGLQNWNASPSSSGSGFIVPGFGFGFGSKRMVSVLILDQVHFSYSSTSGLSF